MTKKPLYLWNAHKFWIFLILSLLIVGIIILILIYKNYEFVYPDKIDIQDFMYAIAGLIALFYTIFTGKTLIQMRRTQSLNILSSLTKEYNDFREKRIQIFRPKDPSGIHAIEEEDLSAFSNFLDGFGQIACRLPRIDQKIVLERWAETFIRSWIRLSDYVREKRPSSLGRDYPFFEWLASKSREFHSEFFKGESIYFFDYCKEQLKFHPTEIYEQTLKGLDLIEKKSRIKIQFLPSIEVEELFIIPKKTRKHILRGECPYCKDSVMTVSSHDEIDCSTCGKRIYIKNQMFCSR